MTAALLIFTVFITLYARIFGLEGGLATGLSIKNLSMGLCIASIGISLSLRKEKIAVPTAVFGTLFLATMIAAASIMLVSLFSPRSTYSEALAIISLKAKLIDPLLMLLIGYFSVQSEQVAVNILRLYAGMISVACALTIIDFFDIPDLGIITVRAEDGRVEGFIGSAAESAAIVAASLPILFYGTGYITVQGRFILYVSAALMVTCVVIAATRAPVLGLICALLIYASIATKEKYADIKTASVIFLATVVFLLFALASTPYWSILEDRFLTGLASGNMFEITSGRTLIWSKALEEMWEHPESILIGKGWDVYYQSIGQRYATHNIFLDRFYSLGIFGLLIYVIAYWQCFRILLIRNTVTSSSAPPIGLASGLSLVVLLVSAMFADLEIAEFYVYAIVGVGLRYSVLQAEPQKAVNAR